MRRCPLAIALIAVLALGGCDGHSPLAAARVPDATSNTPSAPRLDSESRSAFATFVAELAANPQLRNRRLSAGGSLPQSVITLQDFVNYLRAPSFAALRSPSLPGAPVFEENASTLPEIAGTTYLGEENVYVGTGWKSFTVYEATHETKVHADGYGDQDMTDTWGPYPYGGGNNALLPGPWVWHMNTWAYSGFDLCKNRTASTSHHISSWWSGDNSAGSADSYARPMSCEGPSGGSGGGGGGEECEGGYWQQWFWFEDGEAVDEWWTCEPGAAV